MIPAFRVFLISKSVKSVHWECVNGQGDQNILVNVFFSLGMGFALLIMGIDIDLDQVMEAVRLNDQSNMIETLANNIKHARCIHIYSSPSKIMQSRSPSGMKLPTLFGTFASIC